MFWEQIVNSRPLYLIFLLHVMISTPNFLSVEGFCDFIYQSNLVSGSNPD